MKVLILGSSIDTREWTPGGKSREEIVRDLLAAEFGEPVEVVARPIWPDDRMLKTVARWLAEYQPDIVDFGIIHFWFNYRSVPLRVQRLLGGFGPTAARAGFRFAESRKWAHNAVFRFARRRIQATFGGDTHFTTEEVIERCSSVIRLVLREESVGIVVTGPRGFNKLAVTRRQLRQDESRRLAVDRALAELCEQLHVDYESGDVPPEWNNPAWRAQRVGDGIHPDSAGHLRWAEDTYERLRRSWLRRRETETGNGESRSER
jgi:hypothetical protein